MLPNSNAAGHTFIFGSDTAENRHLDLLPMVIWKTLGQAANIRAETTRLASQQVEPADAAST